MGLEVAAAAAIGGGLAAYSSRQKSKSAKSAAEAQRDFLSMEAAPSRELEKLQLEDYKGIYRPQAEKQRDIFLQYADPEAELANKVFTEEGALFTDVYSPSFRAAGERAVGDLGEDFGLPQELADQAFQQGQRRINEGYAPFREAASQRLAAGGSLGSGIAEQVFAKLDDAQLQDLADFAFERAMAEFEIKRTGRQQSLDNVLRLLGLAPSPTAPGRSVAPTSQSAVGQRLPYLDDLYTPPIPKVGINWGEVAQGAIGGAKAIGGMGGTGGAPPIIY